MTLPYYALSILIVHLLSGGNSELSDSQDREELRGLRTAGVSVSIPGMMLHQLGHKAPIHTVSLTAGSLFCRGQEEHREDELLHAGRKGCSLSDHLQTC